MSKRKDTLKDYRTDEPIDSARQTRSQKVNKKRKQQYDKMKHHREEFEKLFWNVSDTKAVSFKDYCAAILINYERLNALAEDNHRQLNKLYELVLLK
jgi:hypothetical protein